MIDLILNLESAFRKEPELNFEMQVKSINTKRHSGIIHIHIMRGRTDPAADRLPLSSNPAEKACHLCVSQLQKSRGMAWSADGFYALAVIRRHHHQRLDSSSTELKVG